MLPAKQTPFPESRMSERLLQHGRMMNCWSYLGFLQPTGSFQKVSDHLFALERFAWLMLLLQECFLQF